MAHTKVYGFCDAKCKVEVAPKSVVDDVVATSNEALTMANSVNDKLAGKLDQNGTAQKSIGDANGNSIISTYARKDEISGAVRKIPLEGTIENGSLTMTNVQSGDVVSIMVFAGDSANRSVFTFMLPTVSGGTRLNTMTPARLVSLAGSEEKYWEYLLIEYYNYKWSIDLKRDKASDYSNVTTDIISFEGTILRG